MQTFQYFGHNEVMTYVMYTIFGLWVVADHCYTAHYIVKCIQVAHGGIECKDKNGPKKIKKIGPK